MFRPLESLLLVALLGFPAGAEPELVVATAASLREPATRTARAFEGQHPGARIRLALGGTNLLAAQVRAGAPIDILLAADEQIVEALAAEGLVDTRFPVASNRLVVVQPPDAPVRIGGPTELAHPELRRIAVPADAVPLGRYARDWLRARGLLDALRPRLVATEHARATLAAVDQGHVDAAIVYATDARLARSARVAFEVPAAEQPRIVYVAARLTRTGQRDLADVFLAFLRGPRSAAVLAAAGFGPRP